jgi:hypothetical protein
MKRLQYAILGGQILSYGLIIIFIFADMTFDLTGIFRPGGPGLSPQMAYVGACLVGIIGTVNLWLTWHYMHKSNTMRDWLVICAWTHRVKFAGRWISLEEFLGEHLGYRVSHGLSALELADMRDELDERWRQLVNGGQAPADRRDDTNVAADGAGATAPS